VSENLQTALAYAKGGFAVFPLVPRTKAPAAPNGFYDATTDPHTITRWWLGRPSCGVAIRTGRLSRIVVLDIDPRHAGDESLADLERKYGPLPNGPTVHTGGGGWHYYLEYPIGNLAYPPGAGEIPCRVGLGGYSGVDLKAEGGYVVAPPSIHPDTGKRYVWDVLLDLESTSLPLLPCWILELAVQGSPHKRVQYDRATERPSEEAEIRIANAIARSDLCYRRFHERSRVGLRGAAAGASESEVDYSLACLLARAGLAGSEIEYALRESRQIANLPAKRQSYYTATVSKALGLAMAERREGSAA